MMNKQSGFTLIELVAVIVLLGVLAVTALPRFIDLRGDARAGILDSLVGSMQSAAVQVYAKALMQDSLAQNDTVNDNGNTIGTRFGYPRANGLNGDQDISNLVDIQGDPSLVFQAGGNNNRRVGYDADGDGNVTDDGCYAQYTNSTAVGTLPTIVVVSTANC